LTIHRSREFGQRVRSAIHELNPDVVYFSRFAGAQYASAGVEPVQVADQHDLSLALWAIAAAGAEQFWVRMFASFNRLIVPLYERRIYSRFDGVVCVSPSEHEATKRFLPPNIATLILPNGADTDFYNGESTASTDMTVVLTGAMNALRNIDAAVIFATKIFPQLRARFPLLRFLIVGHSPAREVLQLRELEGVEVTGEVPDVRPFLKAATVVVAPYWSGSGVKHKVPIAMSMEKAVVLTSNAAQGLDIQDGVHALIADSPQEFATAVSRLISDEALRSRLGRNARQLVVRCYSWTSLVERLDAWLQELVASRNRQSAAGKGK
jgi:glycosyltransferase involved in cell wall biosynthesis